MTYSLFSFIAVLIFTWVHLQAPKIYRLGTFFQSRFFSSGGGVAIAYVFIDLLPKLSKGDQIVKQALIGIFPYFERHVYIVALLGFLTFYLVDRSEKVIRKEKTFWLSLLTYALFNFLVGYAVADKNNPEVKPLLLFTFALALHYFINDFTLNKRYGNRYREKGIWVLIFSLFFGWTIGFLFTLPALGVALISAFIGGGVIMNVTRHELPKKNPNNLPAFLSAAFFYTILLLYIGQ